MKILESRAKSFYKLKNMDILKSNITVARFTKLSYDISYLMIETTLRVTCDLS